MSWVILLIDAYGKQSFWLACPRFITRWLTLPQIILALGLNHFTFPAVRNFTLVLRWFLGCPVHLLLLATCCYSFPPITATLLILAHKKKIFGSVNVCLTCKLSSYFLFPSIYICVNYEVSNFKKLNRTFKRRCRAIII